MVRVDYVEDSLDDYGHLHKSNIRMTHFIVCDILEDLNIDYKNEKTFCGLLSESSKPLRYDIWLKDHNLLIEVDDPHHYDIHYLDFIDLSYNNRFISGVKNVAKRDKIKSDYCKDNDINLLRIPYWYTKDDVINQLREFINIEFDYVLPLINKFIVSDEYHILIYDNNCYYDLNMIYDSYKKYLQNNDINDDVNKIYFKQYMINKLELKYFMQTNYKIELGKLLYHRRLKRKYQVISSNRVNDINPVKKNFNIKMTNRIEFIFNHFEYYAYLFKNYFHAADLPSEELYEQLFDTIYDKNSFDDIYRDIKKYDTCNKNLVTHFKLKDDE